MNDSVDSTNSDSEDSFADAVGIFLAIMAVVALAVTWVSSQ